MSTPSTPSPDPRGVAAVNGNGSAHTSAKNEKTENIFLFWPNLIGQLRQAMAGDLMDARLTCDRLLAHLACIRISLLHASPSAHLLWPVQRLLPPRRARRICRAVLRTVHKIRCRLGHGDRSLHNRLSPRLPLVRMAALGHSLPGANLARSGQSLRAHVCDPQHGRLRSEPQAGGQD
jgi:hypothetical protein